jgi:glyoxylase-like metal-dependent hydrolase (beta-lactamase superfamily II)
MFLLKSFTFNPLQENTYLLYNEEKLALLIDPGCADESEQHELLAFIQHHQLNVQYLINTHAHIDHVMGCQWAFENFHTPLHLHQQEKEVLKMAPVSALMWGLQLDHYKGNVSDLQPGQSIELGKDQLEIIFLPGHSPGHVGFYCKEQQFIIAGDVLFYESIGRTDLPGGNHQQLLNSIRQQLFTLPDATIVYSGHGPSTTIGHEKKHNPFVL